jgi:hypothetical protein
MLAVCRPQFMVGDIGSPGRCPKACGACTVCADSDKACYDDNRRRAGYLVYTNLDSDDPPPMGPVPSAPQ